MSDIFRNMSDIFFLFSDVVFNTLITSGVTRCRFLSAFRGGYGAAGVTIVTYRMHIKMPDTYYICPARMFLTRGACPAVHSPSPRARV